MRSLAAAILLSTCTTACSADRFDLTLRIPERYAGKAADLRLSVLDPPAAAFTCDDLAFGRVDPALIDASRDRELNLRTGDTDLGTFEKSRAHLFVAEAFDAAGLRFAIGCTGAAAGALASGSELLLELEPIALVDAIEDPILTGVFGETVLPPIALAVTDVFDTPLAGLDATWTTYAKGIDGAPAEATTGAGGRVDLSIPAPSGPSPIAVDLRVRWAEESPIRFTGFLRGAERTAAISPGTVLDGATAELDGQATLVLLVEQAAATSLVFCTGALSCDRSVELELRERGRFASIGDQLVLVTPARIYAITSTGAPPFVRRAGGGTGSPLDVVSAGACDAGGAPRILVRNDDYSSTLYELDGSVSAEPAPLDGYEEQLFASGCVDALDGRKIRAFVLGSEEEGTYVVAFDGGEPSFADWSAIGEGIAIGARGEGPLLGAQLDLDAFVIARLSLEVAGDELGLEATEVDYTPAEAVRIAGASFDGDGALDVAAILQDFDPENDQRALHLFAALDDAPSGERISAAAPLEIGLCNGELPSMWVADLDGDGDDDVLLLDRGETCGRTTRVVFIPM